MGVRQFFRRFFPLKTTDDLREEMFALTYCMEGMVYGHVEKMLTKDRVWYLRRLYRQLKRENDEMKRAGKKGRK